MSHHTSAAVISDTHGLLRTGLLDRLRGAPLILHAGDVGDPAVLEALAAVAPLTAVRGNVDSGALSRLPSTASVEVGGVRVYMLHDLSDLDLDPRAEGIGVVVSGHSHRPSVERRDGVLYLNPGSCGPRRFRLPVTLALLTVSEGRPRAEIVHLEGGTRP